MGTTAVLAIGTVVSAVGQMRKGQQDSSNALAQSQAAAYNAQVASDNAQIAQDQAAEQERRQRIAGEKIVGATQASYSANGLTLTGSAMDVIREAAATSEMDALTIRYQGQLKSRSFEEEAQLETAQSKNARTASENSTAGGLLGAAGALLSGYSNIITRTPAASVGRLGPGEGASLTSAAGRLGY